MTINTESNELRELIRVLAKCFGRVEKSELPCCEITVGQCHALIEIGRAENIYLYQLAEILGLDNSTMSRTVNNLVNNQLIERLINPEDRRYIRIVLTDKGKAMYNEIEKSMNDYFTQTMQTISPEIRAQIIESLKILNSIINEKNCC